MPEHDFLTLPVVRLRMQCHSNYNVHFHDVKFRHGPSPLLGIGQHTGGDLWVMSDGGDKLLRR